MLLYSRAPDKDGTKSNTPVFTLLVDLVNALADSLQRAGEPFHLNAGLGHTVYVANVVSPPGAEGSPDVWEL
jgi:hypothetical protein